LNVGPTAEGVIQPEAVAILKEVGAWLKVNGESIYGAGPAPLKSSGAEEKPAQKQPVRRGRRGRGATSKASTWLATARPGKIYIHLFSWPRGTFVVRGVRNRVTQVYLLADPTKKPLKFEQTSDSLSIHLPEKAPDTRDSVVCLVL
ncbi:MAG: alpha-L-fucosidase, partial [Lentisphaerae bacterium]